MADKAKASARFVSLELTFTKIAAPAALLKLTKSVVHLARLLVQALTSAIIGVAMSEEKRDLVANRTGDNIILY